MNHDWNFTALEPDADFAMAKAVTGPIVGCSIWLWPLNARHDETNKRLIFIGLLTLYYKDVS